MKVDADEKYREIFFKKIEKYNNKREFWDHYVQINEDILMVIQWSAHWKFTLYPLEKAE